MIICICSRRQVSSTIVWNRDSVLIVAGKSFYPPPPQRQTNPKITSLFLRIKLAVYCQPLPIIPPAIDSVRDQHFMESNLHNLEFSR